VLRADGVTVVHRGDAQAAVADVGAELVPGEALAVVGPNGSGKSTLAAVLAGLLRPAPGTVEVAGDPRPLWRWRAAELAQRVGTVFQNPEHAFVTRSVAEEIAVGPRRAGLPAAEVTRRVDDLLERLRLGHLAAANPFTLSGGEKRRLSVGGALAAAPDVLVLDEPTFGQDLLTWTELLALLSELRDDGRALAVVTHDQPFADALAARSLRLERGRRVP
jgi:energy-coupling factor transport system ATP-binding protein